MTSPRLDIARQTLSSRKSSLNAQRIELKWTSDGRDDFVWVCNSGDRFGSKQLTVELDHASEETAV
jgi:hypothetical protein